MPNPTLSVPAAWEDLLARLERGTILVVGETGTGKTHLARYLAQQLDRALPRVALVDADPGQASVGVPGCLGLALTSPWEAPAALWFVGDTTPQGHLLESAVGTARLASRGRSAGARAVVIDASGLLPGPAGRTLELHRALAAGVDQVVAVEVGDELGELLALLDDPGRRIHRVPPAAAVRERGPARRATYRRARLRAHFDGAETRWFGRRRLTGRGFSPGSGEGVERGTLVGLLGEGGFCLALGVVEEVETDRVAVSTPWRESSEVVRLQAGTLRIDPDELEEGVVEVARLRTSGR